MVRTFVIALFVSLITGPAWAQPNRLDVLERVRAQYPDVWRAAHRDYPQGAGSPTTKWQAELYVRLAAWKINEQDLGTEHEGRWGINGKRGNCDDLSQDVISYQIRPNWNQMWDVITAAGGPSPQLAWSPFEPSTDATGCFVRGTPITQDEIAHVLGGGRPFPPKPFPWSGVPLGEAAADVERAFGARFDRPMSANDIALFGAWASSLGWAGGDRIQRAVIDEIIRRIAVYSGDPANPFPSVDVNEALRRLNERWQARFGRDVHPVELDIIVQYALTKWDGRGPVPLWLLEEILALSASYDGSLAPTSIDLAEEVSADGMEWRLGDRPFEWRGQTAFMLQYEWFDNPARYRAAVDSMREHGVTVARIGVATQTSYLTLTPQSGGTFGSGRTRAIHPSNTPDFWPRYRAMLADLAQNGIIAEVVPFLLVSAYNPQGECGGRRNTDTSAPQTLTPAARLAYVEEIAYELLPIRAAVVEISNEYNHLGFCLDGREVGRLRDAYESIDSARMTALSSPPDHLNYDIFAQRMAAGDYITIHWDRSTEPRSWSWVINQAALAFRPQAQLRKPLVADEGINADHVGEFGADGTPSNHWANGVLYQLLPGLHYTFHFDAALKGNPANAAEGSLPAIRAWRDGVRSVPADVTGEFLVIQQVLGADTAVARITSNEGYLLLIGASSHVIDVTEWNEELIGAHGPHRLYRLTK